MPTSGASPAPADGRSLRSSSTTSMAGASLKRGTRYCEHGAGARVAEVLQPELHRVELHAARELVDVDFTRKVIGGRGKPAIRALPQRRLRRVKLLDLARHIVERANRRVAGIVVVMLPL